MEPSFSLSGFPASSISETFIKLRKQGKVALIPYITAGDPDLSTTAEALKVLDSCGSDIVELGLPYSDPVLDGPVIQGASARALANGTTLESIIFMLKEVVPQLSYPILLFTYYKAILEHGISKFMAALNDAGVRGLLVPDALLHETETLKEEATKNEIEIVLLTTPITPKEEMKRIVESAEGFVYLVRSIVSSVGVTGARATLNPDVPLLLQEIKEVTSKPVAVGFGISTPEHVKQIAEWGADGVIVGSAMVKRLGESKSPEEGLKELETFARSLKVALPSEQLPKDKPTEQLPKDKPTEQLPKDLPSEQLPEDLPSEQLPKDQLLVLA
ncbi:hypothetical protein AQUCO_04900099v1 [Aquilegia coerulea]|uniref:Uncharacterized protein n=1 Tax=Aquilegia coerulea TaxID=218851 RepID=A0A2G5CJS9_AQUCA|nr:hypothetical protein AQUCO_04900099v1 [Aquilegia coerulea]